MRAMVGDEELVEGIEKGTKVKVKTPVTVYHSPKLGDFNLEGKEGEVMEASHALPPLVCSDVLQPLCTPQQFTFHTDIHQLHTTWCKATCSCHLCCHTCLCIWSDPLRMTGCPWSVYLYAVKLTLRCAYLLKGYALVQVVSLFKGKQTSANLPYKVVFKIPQEEGKDIKLVAHLVRHALQISVC